MRSSITRKIFGAYDPNVWIVQTYLKELGFDPGTVDGLWGPKTLSAALTFRSWAGLPGAAGTDAGSVVDEDFWTQIDRATASAGFDINISAPVSAPGGSGVSPTVSSDVNTGPTSHQETPAEVSPVPMAAGSVLPIALLGLGALLAFGGKKKR